MLVAAGCMLAAMLLMGVALATRTANLPQPTATVLVITVLPPVVQPTLTPLGFSTVPPPTELAPTATLPPPPSAGEIKLGDYVQITGTGDTGFLNLRAEPSLNAPVNYLALEREVLQVQAGPAQADGITWWYLVDPATNTRFGWGAQNYLQVVQGP